jgi:Tfp pilus assembly protein FimV
LVVAVAVTLAVIGGLGWLGQDASERIPADTAIVRVGAGETIWDVAQRVAPESDPRAVVARIRQLNRIEGSALQPGQQLRVPDGR